MAALVVAFIFSVIIIMTVLLIFGAPLGEFSMGGRYKVFPAKLRIAAISMLATQVFGMMIVLQAGGFMQLWFSEKVTQIICYVFGGYFVLNAIMCFFSYSKKEKCVMTPLAMVAAVGFLLTAIQM